MTATTLSELDDKLAAVTDNSDPSSALSLRPRSTEILMSVTVNAQGSGWKTTVVFNNKYGNPEDRGYRILSLEKEAPGRVYHLASEIFAPAPEAERARARKLPPAAKAARDNIRPRPPAPDFLASRPRITLAAQPQLMHDPTNFVRFHVVDKGRIVGEFEDRTDAVLFATMTGGMILQHHGKTGYLVGPVSHA